MTPVAAPPPVTPALETSAAYDRASTREGGGHGAAAADEALRPPSVFSRWWSSAIAAISSELALHGLAYLGVLLLFVGSFGLVAFAFGDVSGSLRPVAEVALAAVPFVAARMLLRRGAVVVGRALELAGGLILPVMVITSFLDGFGVPPDLTGTPLVVALTAAVAGVSAGYAWWTLHHPDSALRFLVAPVAWVAVALAGMGVGREVPSGSGVASVTAVQVGLIAGAMTLSAAAARWRPAGRLAAPTMTAAMVGAPIVAMAAVLTWMAESNPALSIAVTGVLGLVLLELIATRLSASQALLVQTAWWGVVWIGLGGSAQLGGAPAAAFAAVGFVALLEAGSVRRTSPMVLALPTVGAAGALALTWQDPWWAVAMTAAAALWAAYRRSTRAYMVQLAPQGFDIAAAVLPAATVGAIWWATQESVAAPAAAAAAVLMATVPATRPLLRRSADDTYWSRFWFGAMALAGTSAALVSAMDYPASQSGRWLLAGTVAALTVSAGWGPVSPQVRPWVMTVLGTWTWLLLASTVGLSGDVRGLVVAGVGVVLVVGGHVGRGLAVGVAGGWALAGHVLGVGAFVLPGSGWGLTGVAFLATAGWVVTSWFDVLDRSPVGVLLAGVDRWLRFVPLAAVAVGVPVTVALALDAAGVLTWGDAWWVLVPGVTAVVYAAASRLPLQGRVVSVLVWSAVVSGLGAPVVASQTWPAAAALVCLVAGVVLMVPGRRPVFMVWVAWGALAPLVGLVAVGSSGAFGGLAGEQSAAVTLIAVGSAMVLVAVAVGVRGRGWRPGRGGLDPGVLPPVVVGGLEVVAGLVVAWVAVPTPLAGWLTLGAAGAVLGVAVLSGVGALAGASAGLVWVAVLMLWPEGVADRPWIGVLAAAGLLLLGEASGRLPAHGRWWLRWDLGLFVVAHLCALTALSITLADGQTGVTWAAAGLLALAIAVRRRDHTQLATTYAAAGTTLILASTVGLSGDVRGLVVAGVGVVLVVGGHVGRGLAVGVAGGWALAGHVLGVGAFVLPGSGWGLTGVAFLATAGWVVTSWFDVLDRSPVGVLLAGVDRWLRFVPLAAVAVGVPVTVALALDAAGVLTWGDAWWVLVPGVTAVVYAAASRLPLQGRVVSVLVWSAVVSGLGAPVVASQTWPAAAALVCLVAGVVLMVPGRRPVFMVWVAWGALAPLVGLVAVGSSGAFGGLAGEQSAAVTLIAVGSAMVLVAVAVGVRGRGWRPGRGGLDPGVLPPVVVGGLEVVAGLVVAWVAVPTPLAGWLTLGAAGAVLGVAVLSGVGALAGASAGLVWVAVLMLWPEGVADRPWIGVLAAAGLLLLGEASGRLPAHGRWWLRWDLGLFVVAHLCALTALSITLADGQTGVTWAAAGLLALAIAVRRRDHTQLATTYAAAGTTLILASTATEGSGWLALALAALSIALTALAGRTGAMERVACQVGGALSASGAWVAMADWQSWTLARTIDATSLAAAAITLGLAGALRSGRLDRSWFVSWGSVFGLTTALVTTFALVADVSDVDPSAATFAALMGLAVAAQVVATPLSAEWLRVLSAIILLDAELHALALWGADPGGQVAVLTATSLLSSLALVVTRRRSSVTGQRSIVLLGGVANVAAVAVAFGQLPDSALLVPSLLVGAVLAAVIGLVLDSAPAMTVSPVLGCAAWLAFANDALSGNPQWYTIPIGLALLAVVALVRQDRRTRGLEPAAPSIVVLELVGIGVIVGPSLVQSITESLGYALLAAMLGLCLIGWAVLTRVRRRVAAGAAVVVVAIIELVVVPLAQLLPAWGGVGTWVLIIVVGMTAISAATLLEWGRATVRRATTNFAELTTGWE